MSDDNNPFDRFEKSLAGAKKPVEPPTEAELREKIKADFSELWAAVPKFDAAVKKAYDPKASVQIQITSADRQFLSVEGVIAATKPGTSLTGNHQKRIEFAIQRGVIWIKDSAFDAVTDTRTNSGARFTQSQQGPVVNCLSGVLSEFFNPAGRK